MIFFFIDYFISSTEVWCFDLDTYDWYQPEIKFPQPSARYQHSQMKIDDQHLIILGITIFLSF